jgi:hypothetical protein
MIHRLDRVEPGAAVAADQQMLLERGRGGLSQSIERVFFERSLGKMSWNSAFHAGRETLADYGLEAQHWEAHLPM